MFSPGIPSRFLCPSSLPPQLSERDIILGIFHYIDRIVTNIVRPRRVLYMAIDGVAPRAKMNQQRSRRFRSRKDMKEAKMIAQSKVRSQGRE